MSASDPSQSAGAPVPSWTAALAPVRQRHRELLAAYARWSRTNGVAPAINHVALICAALIEALVIVDRPTIWLTRARVRKVLGAAVDRWCASNHCTPPEGVPEAFATFLDFLGSTGRLCLDSDPLCDLEAAVSAEISRSRRRRPP
jgi:hypothetical protein